MDHKAIAVLLAVSVALLGAANLGQAEVAAFSFTGTVTTVSGDVFGLSPDIGQTVHGSFTYDTSEPPAFDTGNAAGYMQPPPSGMSVVISGVTLQSQDFSSLQVINDAFGVDNVNGFFTPILVAGVSQSPSSIAFSLSDFTQTALSSTALPSTIAAESFGNRQGSVFDATSGGFLSFSIDTLERAPMAVTIDVDPGTTPNSINPRSKGRMPVAILTTNAFGATSVDPTTVRFGVTGTEASVVQSAFVDVDGDGNVDMILHFETEDTGIQCGDVSVSLTGTTLDGKAFAGTDAIVAVGCR